MAPKINVGLTKKDFLYYFVLLKDVIYDYYYYSSRVSDSSSRVSELFNKLSQLDSLYSDKLPLSIKSHISLEYSDVSKSYSAAVRDLEYYSESLPWRRFSELVSHCRSLGFNIKFSKTHVDIRSDFGFERVEKGRFS